MIAPSEEWRPVSFARFCDRYQVSNLGRVRGPSGNILAGGCTPKGYRIVKLSRGSEYVTTTIHKLVLLTFVGPKPTPKHTCNHKDGEKANNDVRNLEWTTPGENNDHALRTGLRKKKAALTDDQVRDLRSRVRYRGLFADFARETGVLPCVVREAYLGIRYQHIH